MRKLGTFLLAACMFVPFGIIVSLLFGGLFSVFGAWRFDWTDILATGVVIGAVLAVMGAATTR